MHCFKESVTYMQTYNYFHYSYEMFWFWKKPTSQINLNLNLKYQSQQQANWSKNLTWHLKINTNSIIIFVVQKQKQSKIFRNDVVSWDKRPYELLCWLDEDKNSKKHVLFRMWTLKVSCQIDSLTVMHTIWPSKTDMLGALFLMPKKLWTRKKKWESHCGVLPSECSFHTEEENIQSIWKSIAHQILFAEIVF